MPSKPLKNLDSISPSRYTALKRCALRVVLAETYDSPLLPYGVAGHLGNVIHECIRQILIGRISCEESFNSEWIRLVSLEERKLDEIGFGFLNPLRKNAKNYAIKKLQVKDLLDRRSDRNRLKSKSDVRFRHEEWFNSKDHKIAGRVDFIKEENEFVKLSDFKSGRILEEEGEIKLDYEEQIKLYGYLYFEKTDRFPDELSIIDLMRKEYVVEFTDKECFQIAEYAKCKLDETNTFIRHGETDKLANPSTENCNFCQYKPACKYHWDLNEVDGSSAFTDVQGLLLRIKEFANGNINAYLKWADEEIVVTRINSRSKQKLSENMDTSIAFYNVLRKEVRESFRALKTTMIYAK